MAQPKPLHFFISYTKRETYELALGLRDTMLTLPNTSAWMDEELVPGEGWAAHIMREIDRCDFFVVLLSPDVNRPEIIEKGQERSFVINEINHAKQQRKPIIPVLTQDTSVPIEINTLQYIDSKNQTDPKWLAERICRRLGIATPPEWYQQVEIGKIYKLEKTEKPPNLLGLFPKSKWIPWLNKLGKLLFLIEVTIIIVGVIIRVTFIGTRDELKEFSLQVSLWAFIISSGYLMIAILRFRSRRSTIYYLYQPAYRQGRRLMFLATIGFVASGLLWLTVKLTIP